MSFGGGFGQEEKNLEGEEGVKETKTGSSPSSGFPIKPKVFKIRGGWFRVCYELYKLWGFSLSLSLSGGFWLSTARTQEVVSADDGRLVEMPTRGMPV